MGVDFDYESAFASKIGLARPIQDVQEWLPESNPPPFPDCSVVSHSSLVVSMPTSMTFELSSPSGDDVDNMYEEDYYDQDSENIPQSACDDKFFLGKVNSWKFTFHFWIHVFLIGFEFELIIKIYNDII